MKAPSKRSLCINLCWLVTVLGRSAVYSSGQKFSMGVFLAADIIAVLLGLLVGIDVILAPDLSVAFWLNKRWYSPSQIQVAGWLFLGVNVLLGVMAICTAVHG